MSIKPMEDLLAATAPCPPNKLRRPQAARDEAPEMLTARFWGISEWRARQVGHACRHAGPSCDGPLNTLV
jgi:hypothetical protein